MARALGLLLIATAVLAAPLSRPESLPTPETVVYRLSPDSRFDVVTGKAGLFGAFGHEHRIRASDFSGTIVYDPDRMFRSRAEIVVPTDGLRVVREGADVEDGPEVEAEMRKSVLPPNRYPEIRFRSRVVTARPDGVQVVGTLAIAEGSRPIAVDVAIAVRGDTLRASGSFEVKQTDFGIEPYSAFGGTVKVADEVTFEFDAIGIRETASP